MAQKIFSLNRLFTLYKTDCSQFLFENYTAFNMTLTTRQPLFDFMNKILRGSPKIVFLVLTFVLLNYSLLSKPFNNNSGQLNEVTAFTFDCTSASVVGAFYASGTVQTGYINLKIKNVTAGATSIVVTNSAGFSGGIATTNLVANQATIQIPISYTGAGSSGTYTLNISSPQATNSCSVNIAVLACSAYKPTISTNVPSTLCLGDSIIMTASSGTKYSWSTGETTSSILKKASGVYTVTVTSNGCTNSTSQTVTYNNNCEVGLCNGKLSGNSYNITFGTGTRTSLSAAVPGATTTHIYSSTGVIIDGQYAVANNALEAGAWSANVGDHSGDGATGRLMVINADNTPKECFRLPANVLCSNLKYQFSAWIRSISNKPEKPNVTLEIRDAITDSILAIKGTGDIQFGSWIQFGMTFTTSSSSNLFVVLRNNTRGGLNGNDLVIDDIQFAYCGPPTIVTVGSGASIDSVSGIISSCNGKNVVLSATVQAGIVKIPEYQWQQSTDNGSTWNNISGATGLTYSFVSSSGFNNRKFRLLVGEQGKVNTPGCRVESNVVTFKFLDGAGVINVTGSITPCDGDSVTMTAINGATYSWNTGEKTAAITKKVAGTYTVTITDVAGCISTASKIVTINARPTTSIVTVGESNVNSGGTATLTASGGSSYSWSTGEKTAAISVNKAGTYTVTVTGSNGCTSTAFKTIGPNNAPVATNATFSVSLNTLLTGSISTNVSDIDGNINLNSFSVPVTTLHGVTTMAADGSFTYTPNTNFTGKDSLQYRVCDLGGLCTTAKVYFNIIVPANQPPTIVTGTLNSAEDVVLLGDAATFTSDSDKNLNPNSFTLVETPRNGTIIFNPNGTFRYTPQGNFSGVDSFRYRACDMTGACSTGSIVVNVSAVNDSPILINATPSVQEDNSLIGNVTPNASDADSNLDINSFMVIDAPANGTITMNPSGAYTYKPKANFNGTDSVHFKVCDLTGLCDTATLIISVTSVNDAPILTNATPSVLEDKLLTSSVSANASDVDNNLNNNTFAILNSPLHGTIVMNSNGTYTYTPNANFNGVDSVQYQVCDFSSACSSAMIIITISAVNDAPTLSTASQAVQEDAVMSGNLLPNASDVDGNLNPNSFFATVLPKNGVFSLNSDGTYTYTPKANFNGLDSVQYRVCDALGLCTTAFLYLNVLPVNDAPTTSNSEVTLSEDSPLTASVLLNVGDIDGNLNPNSFALVDMTVNGTITMTSNGTYVYTPKVNFSGRDSVHYRVCDMSGVCSAAKLSFTVTPVNDAPTLLNSYQALDEDLPFTFNVSANASDVDGNLNSNSFVILNSPLHGTISMTPKGVVIYTPILDYVGQDSVQYRVCDLNGACTVATIVLNISSVNDAPTLTNATPSVSEDSQYTGSVLANASDVDGNLNVNTFVTLDNPVNGKITMQRNGTYVYTPNANFNGLDSVHYRVCDLLGACSTASILITVKPVNDAPTVANSTVLLQEDVTVTSSVSTNAFDIDGNLNPNSFTLTDSPVNGSIIMSPNGSFTYTPKANFNGTDSVHYQVCDMSGVCTRATLVFTVNYVNDAPVVTTATPSVSEDSQYNGSVINNVNDPDGNLNTRSFVIVDSPQNGTLTMSSNGNYIYIPKPNFNGIDSVHYQVCDSSGACTVATIIITVRPVNDAPKVTVSTPVITNEDTPARFCGVVNDFDNAEVFNMRMCNLPKGLISASFNDNQVCFDYTPKADFNGVDTVCMLVCDKAGACDTIRIPIKIEPVNDAPILQVNPINVPVDSTIIQCFLITDPDANEAFSATFCDASKGNASTKVENGNICVTYKAINPNYNYDALCVVLCDKTGACTQSYIPINITLCDDKTPPTITCPSNIEVSTYGRVLSDPSKFILQSSISDNCDGVILGFNNPTAQDECGTPSVQQIEGTASGSIFKAGTHKIGFEAIDNSGKKANCQFEIKVTAIPLFSNDNVTVCVGEILTLQGTTIPDAIYEWKTPKNTASTNPLVFPIEAVNQSGLYILKAAFGNNCVLKDTINLLINDVAKVINDSFTVASDGVVNDNILKNDILLNGVNSSVKTNSSVVNGTLSLKNDGSITYRPTAGFKGLDKMIYEVCTDLCPNICPKATVVFTVSERNKAYTSNEVITPNGDGLNDVLIIDDFDANSTNNKSSIVIYNQWGEPVYQAAPYKNDWNGTFNNAPLPEGTYYFLFKPTPSSEPLKTFITILR